MAYLTTEKRKQFFKALGLGEYNKTNLLKFKKKYLPAKYCTDKYDSITDNLLRHCINVASYTKNFKPEEFRCKCGKCSGYPSYMKMNELKNLQTIRTKYGKPMTITSGMRCKAFNSTLRGSSPTSKHMYGLAADFYIPGVTDTVGRRKSLIIFMRTLPGHNWSYGDGWCSKGYAISAPNMGNAVHLDTSLVVKSKVCQAADKLIAGGFKYVYYKDNKGWPINGGNCIRFVARCLADGGIKVSTKQSGLLVDSFATKLLSVSTAEAKLLWEARNGGKWQVIKNSGNQIPTSMLKADDVLLCYNGKTYKHTALYYGNGKIADCNPKLNARIREYSALNNPCKLAFRYIGK